MEKYFLILDADYDRKQIHEHIARTLNFPSYYGKNLDALYDCLGDIDTDICIGVYYEKWAKNYDYVKKILQVFDDIEMENEHIKVFYSQLQDNIGFEDYNDRNKEEEDIEEDDEEPGLLRKASLRAVKLLGVDSDKKRNKK